MECLQCGTEFEAARVTAKYCSDGCKKKFQRLAGQDTSLEGQVSGTFVSGSDPKLVLAGQSIAEKKLEELSGTNLPEVSSDEPCKVVTKDVYINLEKDLKLNLEKDLGVFAWTSDGIFIRPEITVDQVRRVRRLVEAKKGWVHRKYDEGGVGVSTIPRCSQRA